LHRFLSKRGISSTTALIAGAISACSIQAAPVALANSVTAVALTKGALASGSTAALSQGVLQLMAWTKVKTAAVVGALVLLAVGSAIVVAGKTRAARFETAFAKADAQTLDRAPAGLVLRPSRFSDRIDPAVQSGGRFLGRTMPVFWLFSFAYEFPWWDRVVLPADAPRGTYDLLLALPDHPKEALREEIRRQLGFSARRETRMTDVLFLEINDAIGPELRVTRGGRPTLEFTGWHTYSSSGMLAAANQPASRLASFLEDRLAWPVLDRTGLTGNYDITLHWNAQSNEPSENAEIQGAFLHQLGLKLAPGRAALEMLVVEKAPR
jgi:hypothetical protein